jgi:uncharacterized protein (DUF433 family)
MVALFTIHEAASYLNVPASTLNSWTRAADHVDGRHALVTTLPGAARQAKVPFIGLAEALVLNAFRRAGVSLQRIRPALLRLDRQMGIDHALASNRLYTDGLDVLFDYPDAADQGVLTNLVVVRSGQRVFSEIIEEYLHRITYANDGWASLIRLPAFERAAVVVDPYRAFGQPLLEHGGARLEDIIDRFVAGDSVSELAADFSVPSDEVEDVIRAALRPAA